MNNIVVVLEEQVGGLHVNENVLLRRLVENLFTKMRDTESTDQLLVFVQICKQTKQFSPV